MRYITVCPKSLTDLWKKWGATMAEYKDITKLKKEISDVKQELWESSCQNRSYVTGYVSALSYVEGMIASLPAADVEPVKHAAFVRDEEHWYICGNCHHATCSEFDLEGEYQKIEINGKVETIYALKQPNYCKHCGSKMDGKEVQE